MGVVVQTDQMNIWFANHIGGFTDMVWRKKIGADGIIRKPLAYTWLSHVKGFDFIVLGSEYTKIDDNTYIYYDTESKMNIRLIFRPQHLAVDDEKKIVDILSKQYISAQVNSNIWRWQISLFNLVLLQ